MKLTIQNRVVKVDESNTRSWTYSRSSRLHVQNVEEVKNMSSSRNVENEFFMYNKLVAGRDAKSQLDRSLTLNPWLWRNGRCSASFAATDE